MFTAEDRVNFKKAQDEKRSVRRTGKRKWLVSTRYYDDERVESSAPVLTADVIDACGWSSQDGKDYVEYTDIFDTEKAAYRFIKDNRKEYSLFSLIDEVGIGA